MQLYAGGGQVLELHLCVCQLWRLWYVAQSAIHAIEAADANAN